MLMALGVELPEMLVGHGFWTVDGDKISKSRGNVVYAKELVAELAGLSGASPRVASDAIRYFLLREVPFGLDGDFSKSALVGRFNSDLANDLGNLLNRTISMLHRYFGGEVPPVRTIDEALRDAAARAAAEVDDALAGIQFSRALEAIWGLVSAGNRYVEQSAPWTLHREGKETELADVLYNALETARIVTAMVNPFMPTSALEMWRQLGLDGDPGSTPWSDAVKFGALKPGTKAGSADPVFPRIDTRRTAKSEPVTPPVKSHKQEKPVIQFDEFKKLDIRIAKIIAAEKIEGADKLLKLSVDVGEDDPRTVVAGIAQFYGPDELTGRRIVLLANLAPAKIRGVESQGMLLAADVDGRAILLQPDPAQDTPAGATVR